MKCNLEMLPKMKTALELEQEQEDIDMQCREDIKFLEEFGE